MRGRAVVVQYATLHFNAYLAVSRVAGFKLLLSKLGRSASALASACRSWMGVWKRLAVSPVFVTCSDGALRHPHLDRASRRSPRQLHHPCVSAGHMRRVPEGVTRTYSTALVPGRSRLTSALLETLDTDIGRSKYGALVRRACSTAPTSAPPESH